MALLLLREARSDRDISGFGVETGFFQVSVAPEAELNNPYLPPIERVWDRIELVESNCWVWTGWHQKHGYPQMKIRGQKLMVHRITYQHYVGEITSDQTLHHMCENKSCVSPFHLLPISRAEHPRIHQKPTCGVCGSARKVNRKRKDGSPAGTQCLDCHIRHQQAYRARKRAELSL